MEPSASPVPTKLCTSSITKMMLPNSTTSLISPLIRLSNWPRNCVPATSAVKSKRYTSLSNSFAGTCPASILCASAFATAVFPTPGSPINTGLFFVRRFKIRTMRSISVFRPMTGSSFPSAAFRLRFMAYCSKNLRFLVFFFCFSSFLFSAGASDC